MYKKIIISKEDDKPMEVHYEVGKGIENDNYEGLLNKFTPNFEFSLADKMIQDFSSDIVPSFKKSSLFTNKDLEDIVRPFKKYYVLKNPIKKKPKSYFRHMTRHNNHKSKQVKNTRNTPAKKKKTRKKTQKKTQKSKKSNKKAINKK